MDLPHPLPDALVELIAERFRVLGEPMRVRLLDRLRAGDATVGELADALGTSQQNVSKHVGVLARAGLVRREKDGNAVRCAIADPSVMELCELVCGGLRRQVAELGALLDAGPPPEPVPAGVAPTRAARRGRR
jgi:DNA-binding transcriptional ArsR family regulator